MPGPLEVIGSLGQFIDQFTIEMKSNEINEKSKWFTKVISEFAFKFFINKSLYLYLIKLISFNYN